MKKSNKNQILCIVLLVMMIFSMTGSIYASGTGWSFVDGGGTGGLNADITKSGRVPAIATYNGELYVAWQEMNSSAYQIRVKKYDGASWSFVDGGGLTGLNKDATKNAYTVKLVVYNNELYAVWMEENPSYTQSAQIRVKKYDGTSWSFVDGGGMYGLNKDKNSYAFRPMVAIYNGNLYVAWAEMGNYPSQIRVKMYNGTSWSFVDGDGMYGINVNVNRNAMNPTLAVYNNELYAAWQESTSLLDQIRVRKYNGTSWSTVDGGDTTGLNQYTATSAQFATLAVYNNALYVAWHEDYNSKLQIRVKKFDQTGWSFVDGGGATGLNKDIAQSASYASLEVYHGKLYAAWQETVSNVFFQVRVKKFDGTNWSFADGGGMEGLNMINHDTTAPAQFPVFAIYNDELYAAWHEGYRNVLQIRVGKANVVPFELSLTTQNGTTFGANLKVNSPSTEFAKLIFAEYHQHQLIKLQSVDVDLSQIGDQTFPFSLSQQNPGQDDSISVFLWNDFYLNKPLCAPAHMALEAQ